MFSPLQTQPSKSLPFREWGLTSFLLFCALANTAVFQWPLFMLARSTRSALDGDSILAILTLLTLQLTVSLSVLGFAALLSIRLLKLLCALFALGNSVALYFIVQYKVMIDMTMMGNVFNTRFGEASELAHPKLLLYLFFLGILPAVGILRVRIRPMARARRLGLILIVLMLGPAWLYANSERWLWIDKHAKQFGSLILPWSYVVNTVRYYSQEAERHRVVELLPDARSTDPRGKIVVLVIGESARAQNFSLLGYPRETNPRLKALGVVAYPGAESCNTYTTASLRCMLSHQGSKGMNGNDEPLPSYLYRQGVEVVWRTNNFGEPPMTVSRYETAGEIAKTCQGDCAHLNYDGVLLQGLAERLRNAPPDAKTLIVLHQTGSHGPQYFKKYPPEFESFKPTCKSVELSRCSHEELVNAYDNSIVYTDYFLSQVVEMLKSIPSRPSAMLYMSDHGESLGENGVFLHGIPMAIAPEVQKRVPLLTWVSKDFVRADRASGAAASPESGLSHDVVFHSVMGALGLTSPIHVPALDILSAGPRTQLANKEAGGK